MRHFVGWTLAGYYWSRPIARWRLRGAEFPLGGTRTFPDWLLGLEGIEFGRAISGGLDLSAAGDWIRLHLRDRMFFGLLSIF